MPYRISNAAAPISLSFATRSASNAAAEFWSSVDNGIYLSGVVVVVGVWVGEKCKMREEERKGEHKSNTCNLYSEPPSPLLMYLRCGSLHGHYNHVTHYHVTQVRLPQRGRKKEKQAQGNSESNF
jgi:hypothetical protein